MVMASNVMAVVRSSLWIVWSLLEHVRVREEVSDTKVVEARKWHQKSKQQATISTFHASQEKQYARWQRKKIRSLN